MKTIKASDAKFGRFYVHGSYRVRCVFEALPSGRVTFVDCNGNPTWIISNRVTELPPECDSFDWQPSMPDQPPITLGSVWEIEKKEYQVRFETSGFVLRSVKSGSACSWGAHESNIEKLAKVIADDSMKFIRQDPITSDIVDVDEGWELVTDIDRVEVDHEVLCPKTGQWLDLSSWPENSLTSRYVYRRRIKPAHNLKVCDWVRLKDGSIDQVIAIHGEFIALQNEHSHAVKCVTKVTFRPFASKAELAPHRRDYVMFPDKILAYPLGYYGSATIQIDGAAYSYEYLLEKHGLTFENGQPFGIAEDVK